MPEQNIIGLGWDYEAFDAETKTVLKDMQSVYDLGIKISQQKIGLGSTGGFTELKAAVEQTNNLTDAHTKLTAEQKAAEAQTRKLQAEQAKGKALATETAVEIAKVTLQNQAQVKSNKEVAASVLGLVDDYGLLKKEYNEAAAAAKNLSAIALRTGDAGDVNNAAGATAKAKSLHDSLLQIEQGVGQSQRNVGNYTGALKILETALSDAKAKLDSMTQSEQQNTQAGQKLQHEVGLLSTLAGEQSQGFASLRREVMNATQALATMESQGLEHTEGFKQLQTEVANSKRGLNEFVEQQKLLASESPAIAGLTAAAKGLGAAYAIGAGASALFANGNEKVEKELNKLVAVMTLLQGLSEVNKTLQERSAIVTSLRGVKEAILNGILVIRNFILTGSIKAQRESNIAEEESIAVKEADAAVTTEVAVATTAAGVAMTVFRAALIATGIGALVILLTAAVVAMVDFANSTNEAATSIEEFKLQIDRLQESLDDETAAIEFNTKRQIEYLKQKGATEREQLDRKIQGDKYVAEAYAKAADEQIAKAKEVASQYGITIDGAVKSAEDAKKILETLQDIKASNPEYEDLDKKQKEAFEATIDTFKKIYENYKHIQKLQRDDELEQEELKTRELTKRKKKQQVDSLQALKDSVNNEFEIYKVGQEAKLRLLDNDVKNDKLSFDKRLQSLSEFGMATKDLLARQEAEDIANKKRETDREVQRLTEEKAGKSKRQKDRLDENIKISKENLEKDLSLIHTVYADKNVKVDEDSAKQQKAIAKEAYDYIRDQGVNAYKAIEKAISDSQKDEIDKNEINKNNKLLQLDKDFHSGKINNVADYNKKKQDIEDAASIENLRKDEDRIDKDKSFFGNSLDLQRQYSDDEEKIRQLGIKKELENRQILADSELNIARSVQDVIIGLTDARYEREIEAIQKVIDLNNERKDQDIANVNASTLSNQEKAAQLIILDNTVAANNHKLAVEQYQIKVKEAKFDRDAAILEIIENAAIAEFKLPAQAGFAGIAAGIAIGVQAAAQISLLLAKPLPTPPAYAKGIGIPGRGEHPGGPAIVGEAGIELVSPSRGRPFIANRAMLLHDLPPGSKVFPSDILAAANISATSVMNERYGITTTADKSTNDRALIDAMYDVGRMTAQAMRKQKGTSVIVNVNNTWGAYITKTVRE